MFEMWSIKCFGSDLIFFSILKLMFVPFLALTSVISNLLMAGGVIVTSVKIGSPAWPVRRATLGFTSAAEMTSPVRVSSMVATFGSSVYTVACCLIFFPALPSVLTFNVISPVPPGGICLEYETVRHPHPEYTPGIFKGASPLLLMLKR